MQQGTNTAIRLKTLYDKHYKLDTINQDTTLVNVGKEQTRTPGQALQLSLTGQRNRSKPMVTHMSLHTRCSDTYYKCVQPTVRLYYISDS